jgi:FkbM family methyltransferase
LDAASVVYSFGVGDNIAWDLAMIERFGLTVHAFDPTPASVAWLGRQNLSAAFHFHPWGIAAQDGLKKFRPPRRGMNFTPLSSDVLSRENDVDAPVYRLATIMERLGHATLDVLKMDIEGAEYEVLDDILKSGISVRQVLVEYHHHFRGVGLGRTEQAIRELRQAGYRVFHISRRGLELSFVKHE